MFSTDCVSCSPPTKTWTATAETFIRAASSMSSAIRSFERSLRIDGPPLARITIPPRYVAGIVERSIPRVSINASACGAIGTIVRSTRSRPVVGPWK